MTQAEFHLTHAGHSGDSQCGRILAHLGARAGEWIPMPELYRISGAMAVHSRISDLRKQGHNIEHKNHREPGSNNIHSFYRLNRSADCQSAISPIANRHLTSSTEYV